MGRFRIGAVAWLAVFLCACGGGGGGGSGSGGGGSGGGSGGGFQVSLNRSSISLSFRAGATPPSQSVVGTWTGTPPTPLYIGATADAPGTGINLNIPIVITQSNATATITAASGLAVGTYTGRINFMACTDSACTQRVGGTPLPVTYTVDVTPPVFNPTEILPFGWIVGAALPTAKTLDISSAAGAWTATASQPWITLSATSGSGAGQLMLGVSPQSLAAGSYSGSVVVNSATLGQQSIVVALTVIAPVASVSMPALDFTGPNGSVFQPATVEVSLTNGAVLPMTVTADKPWISVSSGANGPGQFQVSVNPAVGTLAHGDYTGNVHVHLEGGANDFDKDVPVHLGLQLPVITVNPAPVVLGGADGRAFNQVSATVSLNTGSNAYPWSVSAPPAWVTLGRSSGTAGAAGQTLTFDPHRALVTPGTTTATLTFTATVNGDTVTSDVPVSFNLDTHRLIANEVGVGFVSTPSATWRRLTNTIGVRSNFGEALAWTASSSASWLSAVRSGNNVVLTADPNDPAVATSNQLYEATVTVTDPSGSAAAEHIHVGFWVNATTPTPYAKGLDFSFGGGSVAADPVRPYVYIATTGGIIQRANPYTQSEVLPQISLASLGVTNIAWLAPSSDGQYLFVHERIDANNVRILRVDLTTLTSSVLATPPPRNASSGTPFAMTYARPNGVGMLVTSVGHTYLAESAVDIEKSPVVWLSAASRDGSRLFDGDIVALLDYTSAGAINGTLTITTQFAQVGDGSTVIDTAANLDGSAVYMTGGALNPIQFYKYNGITLAAGPTFPATGFLSNVEVDVYGRFIGTSDAISPGDDFWIYGANDALIHSMLVSLNRATERGTLALTPDGCYAVVREGGSGNLYYVALGPP